MKTTLTAIVLAATLAQPAWAITFPSLTTIYVGAGIYDSGTGDHNGSATAFHCSNVSGVNVQVRFAVLAANGAFQGGFTRTLSHGQAAVAVTHLTNAFLDTGNSMGVSGILSSGTVNIETTNSGVFCTAMIVDATSGTLDGVDLHLVRINPHPGSVE